MPLRSSRRSGKEQGERRDVRCQRLVHLPVGHESAVVELGEPIRPEKLLPSTLSARGKEKNSATSGEEGEENAAYVHHECRLSLMSCHAYPMRLAPSGITRPPAGGTWFAEVGRKRSAFGTL